MIRERRFMVFAFVALLFAAAWLLLGAYARARSRRARVPRLARVLPAGAGVAGGRRATGRGRPRYHARRGRWRAVVRLAGLAGLGWTRRRTAFDRRWFIPALGLAFAGSATIARLADTGLPGGLWQQLAALMTLMLLWWLVLRERRFWRPLARGIRGDACSTAARVDGDGTNPGGGHARRLGHGARYRPAVPRVPRLPRRMVAGR